MSQICHVCGPVKHEAPTLLCASCALAIHFKRTFICWWRTNPTHHLIVVADTPEAAALIFAGEMYDVTRASQWVALEGDGHHFDVEIPL